MKAYLDSEDSYYRYNEESIKEELINVKVNRKTMLELVLLYLPLL